MSRGLSVEKIGRGPALRWAGAGALVLGVHLGIGALLLGRSMPPPDAAVVGIPIDLEPVTVPQDATAPAPAPPAPETPADQGSEPPRVDPTPAVPPDAPPPGAAGRGRTAPSRGGASSIPGGISSPGSISRTGGAAHPPAGPAEGS